MERVYFYNPWARTGRQNAANAEESFDWRIWQQITA